MSRVDDLALLHDIERHDYAHVPEDDDLLKVRVTLDLVVSRADWDKAYRTGTDPQTIVDSVRRTLANDTGDAFFAVRSARAIQFAAVAAVRRMRLTGRR